MQLQTMAMTWTLKAQLHFFADAASANGDGEDPGIHPSSLDPISANLALANGNGKDFETDPIMSLVSTYKISLNHIFEDLEKDPFNLNAEDLYEWAHKEDLPSAFNMTNEKL